jgi:hypothetical protein
MTPQERQLVTDLFGRLASLENNPRDPEAERAIIDGLRTAPNAVYALVQTVLVQDEALKRANAQIDELQNGATPTQGGGGFLDQMREAFIGGRRDAPGPGSVPNAGSRWGQQSNQGAAPGGYAQNFNQAGQPNGAPFQGGGSFLGTAAAAAAGVIGGSILMNSLGSMFGHRSSGQAFAGEDAARGGSPWGDSAGSELSRDAGLNDIGRGSRDSYSDSGSQRAGLFDDSNTGNDDFDLSDSGGDFDGGGDSA